MRLGVALAGAGTNAATMALGSVSAYEAISTPGVTRTVVGPISPSARRSESRSVKANSSSANYTLAAALGSADATNTWKINATTSVDVESEPRHERQATDRRWRRPADLTVPFTASTGAISKVLNFTATAN